MEHAFPDPSKPSPEHSIAELLRVTLLLMKPHAHRVGPQAQLPELENQMRHSIRVLEGIDAKKRKTEVHRVLQIQPPISALENKAVEGSSDSYELPGPA